MAPSHLSVREMRDDEKPLVLEMLKVRTGARWGAGGGLGGGIGASSATCLSQPGLLGRDFFLLSGFWLGPFF